MTMDDGEHREIARLIGDLRRAERERDEATARAERAEARVAELEAIIAGRTTPPTEEEIAAHDAAGGRWLVRYRRDGWGDGAEAFVDVLDPRDVCDGLTAVHWWPLDADGRPCAWPTAEVSR